MKIQLLPFHYQDKPVRVVLTTEGEPMWIAKDVCDVLHITNNRMALSRLDDDQKDDVSLTDAIGRTQQMGAVNESGLYDLILRSDKPEAKTFRKWVTKEVLPQIRKTGQYMVPSQAQPDVSRIEARLKAIEARLAQRDTWPAFNPRLLPIRILPTPTGKPFHLFFFDQDVWVSAHDLLLFLADSDQVFAQKYRSVLPILRTLGLQEHTHYRVFSYREVADRYATDLPTFRRQAMMPQKGTTLTLVRSIGIYYLGNTYPAISDWFQRTYESVIGQLQQFHNEMVTNIACIDMET